MQRTGISLTIATLLGIALTAAQAQAWGGFRAGRTSFGYGGVSHASYGAYRGPYGGGAYHAGVTGYRPSTGVYHYGTTGVGGYYGGAHTYSAYHSPYYGAS